MSNEEDERFARDLEKALELSRITERQDNDRRKKFGMVPLVEGASNDMAMNRSPSAPSFSSSDIGSNKKSPMELPMPAVSHKSVTEQKLSDRLGVKDSVGQKGGAGQAQAPSVRARPRPRSNVRSCSPADARRSGFIESQESDKLKLSSSLAEKPADSSQRNEAATREYKVQTATGGVWEDFLSQSGEAMPRMSVSGHSTDRNSLQTQSQSTDTVNSCDSNFLNADEKRNRADSSTNLIALSPMSKAKINQHYKLDLDELFGASRPGTSTPPLTDISKEHSIVDLSMSWPSSNATAEPRGNTHNVVKPNPPSPAKENHVAKSGSLLPPPIPPPRTLIPNQTSTRQSIKSSRTSFDISQFFDDILDTNTTRKALSPNASSNSLMSLSMPPGRAPTLPPPPPLPTRPGSQSIPGVARTSVSVKRSSTPTSDLLDFSDGTTFIPEVKSVELFDPLFVPSEDERLGFEHNITELQARLSTNIKFEIVQEEADQSDTMDTKLLDPFSYEELSMALMTASRIKGDDLSLMEETDLEERVITPTNQSRSQVANSEMTQSNPPHQHNENVPGRPPKPPGLSATSPKCLRITNSESMDEFTSFSVMVARLKADYRHDDNYTNLGIVFSATMNTPSPVCLPVQVTVFTDMSADPIEFSTDVNTSVEIIIWTVMSNISADLLQISVDDYILKVFDYSEYLVNDSSLWDYAYTQNSMKMKKPIRLRLLAISSLEKPFLRQPGDDEEPIYMIKDELHGDKSYKVQPADLQLLYTVFCQQAESVNKTALEQGLTNLKVTTLLQSVKAITSVLLGAATLEIQRAITQLESILRQVDDNIHDNAQFMVLMERFQLSMEILSTGVRGIIKMYCETFHVRYNPGERCDSVREVGEVTDSLENILVHVGSVHRIPARIRGRFDNYKIIVSLFYAGDKVTEHISTDVYSTASQSHQSTADCIYFDQWLELTDYPMCLVPMETRVLVTLCAMNVNLPVGGSGANVPNKWNNIGWVSFLLFDFKRNVTQGNKLLSMWQGVPNPTGATGSNIWQANTILLQLNLPDFGYDLRFPSSLVTSHRNPTRESYDIADLPDDDMKQLQAILSKPDSQLTDDDREFMWSKRLNVGSIPEALSKVLLSAPEKNYTGIHLIQDTLDSWAPLNALDAMQLLLPDFPCQQIRDHAVKSLKTISSDELCDYLPQLVQALKFENNHDSALARLLLERSITSVRLAQQLYWALKDSASQAPYRERYKLVFGGLVSVMGKALREEVEREELLVRRCHNLAKLIKDARSDSREKIMSREILSITDLLRNGTLRLPTDPSHEVDGVDIKLCTYFNSFTLPLKLVFKSKEVSAPNHYIMYKVGDDLRQDMIVMQLVRIMDRLWLQNHLDLRLVTFTCLPTGDARGIVELITDCETLRKIQTSSGITGSFKDQPLANWLQKHNPTHSDYNKAVENFTLSCAGYCVATYIMGVGDRHNDNIMVKRTGHIFHIDFSKFLGDAQMFGSFKRDRTPFVLTPDMAYVINGGDKPTLKFQHFVDLCCEAFNSIRDNADGLITLLQMMTISGIKGMTTSAVDYVRSALLPDQTNSEATASFTRMIEESLKSKFVQLNFFMHNLAQLKFSSHSDGDLLSFIPTTYSLATDGRIINIEIFDYQKRYHPEKHYVYIIKVHRERQTESTFVYRRYSEFQEFYNKLVGLFPMAVLPKLPGSILLGRTHVQKVAEKRKAELETFLRQLLLQAREISEHDLLYTFFHPMLRDEKESNLPDTTMFKDNAVGASVQTISGEVKLSIQYKQHALKVMVMHVKGLKNEIGDRPNPYVKLYLLPDAIKTSKRKTKIVRSTFHPTYNEMIEYRISLSEVLQRTLQVTTWSAELTGNEFLGAVHIRLHDMDLSKELCMWHKFSALHKIHF